jgi:competence protein ComEC
MAISITGTPSAGSLVRMPGLLAACFVAERDRWALWLPVGLAVGIGLYFALPDEPPGWAGAAATLILLGGAGFARRGIRAWALALLALALPLGVVAAGFALAQLQSWRVASPMLDHPTGFVAVSGVVADLEALSGGTRVTLVPSRIEGLQFKALPHLVRIKFKGNPVLAVGDRLEVKASLMPPPGPALPGGFDFQRQAWFRGLGAVGYALAQPEVTPGRPAGVDGWLRALRVAMTRRIQTGLGGPSGGIAAALITGERGAVPEGINQDYRDSGLAHLLVIAGLHMTLVTGFVFFALRAVLALVPAVALRFPIKKWAALAALVTAFLYLVISGAAVPTERAFVMVALGLVAILIDRLHVSMQGVAWAAGCVLAVDPVAVTGVSFQMSFAAVIGLVAFYETFGARLSALRQGRGAIGRGVLHLAGIALTTIVATLATAGFAIYHFNRFALFSVLANLIAVPLAGLWVMPWAFAACLLMPLGLERIGLAPMGWGLDAIQAIAHWTATLPYAVFDLPAMPDWGLAMLAAGGLWLALWRTRWRIAGVAPMLLGVASLLTTVPPDLLVAADGRLVALRSGGGYLLSSDKADRVEAEAWLRAAGGVARSPFPAPGEADATLRCDHWSCVWQSPGGIVALPHDLSAVDEDCRRAVLVVASITVRRACRDLTTVVDRNDLRRDGATAIWFTPAPRIETANGARGRRPWVIRPPLHIVFNSDEAARPDDPAP